MIVLLWLQAIVLSIVPYLIAVVAATLGKLTAGILLGCAVGAFILAWQSNEKKYFDSFLLSITCLLGVITLLRFFLPPDLIDSMGAAFVDFSLVLSLFIFILAKPAWIVQFISNRTEARELEPKNIRSIKIAAAVTAAILSAHASLIIASALYYDSETIVSMVRYLFYGLLGFALTVGLIFFIIRPFLIVRTARKKLEMEAWREKEWAENPANPAYILQPRPLRQASTRKNKKDEILPLVDQKGTIIGSALRSRCHSGPGLLHPVVHLHIIDEHGRLLLQKRAMNKDTQPGKWDTAVGGHVGIGESIDYALERELLEELGVNKMHLAAKDATPSPVCVYCWETEVESEFVFTFILKFPGPFRINTREVEKAEFWTLDKIRAEQDQGIFTPNLIHEIKMLTHNFLIPLGLTPEQSYSGDNQSNTDHNSDEDPPTQVHFDAQVHSGTTTGSSSNQSHKAVW